MTMDHDSVRALLGPFALDAVEERERREVERHLETCDACRAELDRHLEAAAALAVEETPPPGLWEGIRSEIHREDVVALPRRTSRSRGTRVAAAVAAAAVVVAAVLTWRVIDLQGRLDDAGRLAAVAAAAAEDPDALTVPLRSDAGDLSIDAVVLPDGSGFLLAGALPPLPEDRTYQLWAVLDDRVVSAGVLGSDPRVVAFSAPPETAAFAVTDERAGGVVSSSRPPVVVGEIAPA